MDSLHAKQFTASAAQAHVGNTPVRVGRSRPDSAPVSLHVHVADQKTSNALGLEGVVLAVGGNAGKGDPAHVSFDYGSFAGAFGGGWADRLRLYTMPACALTTPNDPVCRKRTLVPGSTNDAAAKQVTADVPMTANAFAQPQVLAVAAASEGSAGAPTALPLSPAGSWSSGGASGDFSYTYSFPAANAPGGETPNLALAYSSGSIDGLTSATNNQTSWVGDGWDFTPGGYVERHYQSCSEDLGGNNGQTKTGDECWGVDNATLVLGGKSTELIKVSDTLWRPKEDDGSKVELLTGAANDVSHGQYWKVTTGDGTQYFLGMNHLPGWTTGKPETHSAWTVPVFGNNPGEDCYKADDFAHSFCNQAWRWNLDYIVDPHGNVSTFYYQPETNYYGLNLNATSAGTAYTAGGYPLRVEYGLRLADNSVYGSDPTHRVVFDTAERCIPTSTFACDPAQLTRENAGHWPDVPFDQICAAGKTCDYGSPAFFTRKRLVAVHTQYFTGTTPHDIDEWDLAQDFPGSGDAAPPALWLTSITHTGKSGPTPITLPPTTFDRYIFANRVDTLNDKYAALTRSRIKEIRTETGGRITVNYSAEDCVPGQKMPASPETDTYRCYASYWSPPEAKDPVLDYFNKFVVTDVREEDGVDPSAQPVETHYDYPVDGAAWHYDEGQFTPAAQKTWGEWRGYDRVTTSIGAVGKTRTVSESVYLRGMDGDHLTNGTRHVSVPDSDGGSIVDQDPLQGFVRESRSYLDDGKTIDSSSINDPWLRGPTATSSDGLLKAYMIDTGTVRGRSLLSDGKTYQRTQVNKKFDDNGQVVQQEDLGDLANAADDTCTKTTYVVNNAGMFDRADEVSMFGGTCAGSATSENNITDVQVIYDHGTFGSAPTKGDITENDTLDSWDASGKHFVPTSKNSYDDYGRETSAFDVFGKETKTAFTPAVGGPVTATTITNPKGWTSTTTVEPARGNPTSSVDANNIRTDITYDALGRKTAVWNPGQSTTSSPTAKFEYTESNTAPTTVHTKTLQANSTYSDSYAIYDGLGRARQTQVPAEGGGRIITDTMYDSRGLPFKTNGAYFDGTSAPSGNLVSVADNVVVNQTVNEYDTRGRQTASILMSKGVEQWRTTTIYAGDRTTTIPPAGGSPVTVVSDVQGQPIQQLQYTSGYTPGGVNPADVTNYTYNAAGAMTAMTDSSGNKWTMSYDLRGRKIAQTDPDAGAATFGYDAAGQLTSTTDARGKKLFYTYDELGRKTAETQDSPTGPVLATWTYDTLTHGLGQPVASTRFDGSSAYVNRVESYDAFGRPTKTAVDIPAKEDALAGTYEFSTKYDVTGAVTENVSPKAGNLLQEHIEHTYTALGRPATTYTLDSNGARTDLVSATGYTQLNEMSTLQLDGLTSPSNVGVTQTYDTITRRPQTTTVSREAQVGSELTKRSYTYDPAGNVRKISDTPAAGTSDIQCFDYDYLQRLTDAWTPSSGDCATQRSSSTLAGAAPYWDSYTYDKSGNRRTQVEHQAAGDVTTTYNYPDAGPDAVGPHGLQATATTGPTGTSTTSYTYDESGATKTRDVGGDTQTYTYDSEGHTATETDPGGQSSYVYDADGNRLISHDPTGATLSIGDLEIFQTAGTHATSAIRFYEHGGSQIAERAGSAGLKWMLGDLQGTGDLSVTQGTLQPTKRYTDPFGNARAETSTWPDKHGFVGGYQDTTGLTHLGAREYDPTTGRFTKTDPELNPASPQSFNAYSYANNSPVTMSDPDGLAACVVFGGDDGRWCYSDTPQGKTCNCGQLYHTEAQRQAAQQAKQSGKAKRDQYVASHNVDLDAYHQAQATAKKSKWDVFVDAAGELVKSLIGWDDIKDCVTQGAIGACVRTIISFIPWGKILKTGEIVEAFWKGARALVTFGREVEKAEKVVVDTERVLADAERAGADAEQMAVEAQESAAQAKQAAEEAKASGTSESSAGSGSSHPDCNSFVAGTQVLLADGTTKSIEQVHNGDVVLTTDPATGVQERHTVVGTIVHGDEDARTQITVESDGKSGTVTATDWHLFWVEGRGWTAIGDLKPGDHLHSADDHASTIVAVRHFTQSASVYDLTVDRIHDFFVAGIFGSLLVHNCGEDYIAPEGKFVSKEARIAKSLDRSVREVKDAIHAVKRQGKLGGARSNPDIMVDVNTGEVHTKLPCGCPSEDSIGNIHDYLPDPEDYGGRGANRGRRP
ncbi:RHS repeat-associated core domain-containing protein [Amycolatopsis sp. NPDC047767]|uniref:RHS repeat-associated core domain-containing protein n=2 Tax=Amycolatopsis TaxID=1813 RepID=UPI003451DB55